ncbi:hypothetical protein MY11210_008503 [Beauveria gryllotalpidicola]
MSSSFVSEAKARMLVEFINAGHTSLAEPTHDDHHPLHRLFLDTQSLLQQYYHGWKYDVALCELDGWYRPNLHERLLGLKDLLDKAEHDDFEILSQNGLPSHAELLALRFATPEESDNVEIVKLLTTLNILHLWHVPSHTDTAAKIPETNDDAEDLSTEGAPTEGDSKFETALKVELADADRKIKAIQDAKEDLKRKLAMIEEAETAMLQARDAMTQTQNAMAKADLALMQSPMSFLAEDN